MSLASILKNLLFDRGIGSEPEREFKSTDSRMYRVTAVVDGIAPEPKKTDDPEIFISPRRVLNLKAPRVLPATRSVRLRFIEVTAGCIKASRGEELPNLLLENPNVLKAGWYDVAIASLTNLCVGQIYNGVVLVHPSQGIKTFTPSPRNAFVVSDVQESVVEIKGGLTS